MDKWHRIQKYKNQENVNRGSDLKTFDPVEKLSILAISFAFLLPGCGDRNSGSQNKPDSTGNATISVVSDSVPGIDSIEYSDTVALEANEYMRFDKEIFKVKVGKKIVLILKNTSSPKPEMSMSHNLVILAKGTDIADFADAVKNAKSENYLPASVESLVIAHTKTLSGGETDQKEFVLPTKGTYDFICSFPGHWGTMQGKIVAK